MPKPQRPAATWLGKLNLCLAIISVGLGLYIGLFPVLPQVGWWYHHRGKTYVAPLVSAPLSPVKQQDIPKGNLLVIPRLNMRETIHTGSTQAELAKGVWLIPATSSPDKASNTVIAGHRFTYKGAAVFYFLDKLQVDDPITVDWNQREYTYIVTNIKAVQPTDLSVQNASKTPELTLFTCTPLWTSKQRLVITATLKGVSP